MIIECPSCGSTQSLNHLDGWQCCEHCEQVFPVPDAVLRREMGEDESAPRQVIREYGGQ